MADGSAIEWTDATWTPIRARWFEPQDDGSGKERVGWHCEHVSEGCRNCYAERINLRLGTGLPFKPGHRRREIVIGGPRAGQDWRAAADGFGNDWSRHEPRGDVTLFLDETMVRAPLRWKRSRMIFVCSMTDLFADFVPDAWIDRVFAVMMTAKHHTFQVLTKRSARMRAYCNELARCWVEEPKVAFRRMGWLMGWLPPFPAPNIWLGVSAEDQRRADERVVDLIMTPAAVRWVSYEPALGPLNFLLDAPSRDGMRAWTIDALSGSFWSTAGDCSVTVKLDWVVAGGESGPDARSSHPDWFRSVRDQCAAAGVPFLFKQWGEYREFDTGSPDVEQVDADGMFARSVMDLAHRPSWIAADGASFDLHADLPEGIACRLMERVGKKAAGRLLDGVLHDDYPEASR